MGYAKLLTDYIERSELSLRRIAELCNKKGFSIDHSYISKLKNGKMPPPSEELSRVLAEVLGGDPEILVIEGYKEKAPEEIRKLLSDKSSEEVLRTGEEEINQLIEQTFNNNKLKKTLIKTTDILKGFYKDRSGETNIQMAIPYILNMLSIVAGNGPIYPRIELSDILENKDLQITEGGEVLSNVKRKKLIDAIKSADSTTDIYTLPLIGNIRAGIPLLSEQNIIGHIDIPSDLVGRADFALNVHGDSMIGAGINTGDIVICKENHEAVTGQIVVALVDNDETTLKYYFRENGTAILRAANPDYKDIEFKPGDIIQGHVVKILKDPPPVNTYREFIYFKEGHLQEWNKVIEKAVALGFKPSSVVDFFESQIELAKRLIKS